MSNAFLREIVSQIHHHAVYLDPRYGDVSSHLREIALIDPSKFEAEFALRKVEMLSSYGLDPIVCDKPFAFSNGVAIIPIQGLLLNRLSWSCSFATGYDFIRSQMTAALNDPDVERIVFDVNSSGGMAAGCGELAADIFQSRSVKPSLAVVDSRCYSAAIFLASAASRIAVIPSGGVGSIGCLVMHVDMSGALEQEGLKVTFIVEGDEKVDGNPYEPLSSRARDAIQTEVSYQYGLFVGAVARYRGLSEDDVRATEARCYTPPDALDIGLIDMVQPARDALLSFMDFEPDDEGVISMATKTQEESAPTIANSPSLSAADVDRLVAEGVARAMSANQSRIGGIRGHAEAKGREALADHLAFNTSMSIEDATAVLAAAPKTTSEAANPNPPVNPAFAAAMAGTPNPNIGADPDPSTGGPVGAEATPEAIGSRILRSYSQFTGQKVQLPAA